MTHFYPVKPEELGPIAKRLRQREDRTLVEIAALIGCHYTNLSRAENSDARYASVAARAIEALSEMRAKAAGEEAGRPVVRAEYWLPPNVADVVDEVRAPVREARRRLVEEVFGEAGLYVEAGERPNTLVGDFEDRSFRVDLDTLVVTVRTGHMRRPVFRFRDEPDEDHLRRAVRRIKQQPRTRQP